jgi:hypothetical protein
LSQRSAAAHTGDGPFGRPSSNRDHDFAREPASPTRAILIASAGVFGAALLLTPGFCLRCCRQLEHGRALTDVEPRQQLHLAIGELDEIVMTVWIVLVELAEDRNLVERPRLRKAALIDEAMPDLRRQGLWTLVLLGAGYADRKHYIRHDHD